MRRHEGCLRDESHIVGCYKFLTISHLVAVREVVPALGICLLAEHLVVGDGEDLQPSCTCQRIVCIANQL